MGQKVNPIGFRLSLLKNWKSKWCVKSRYAHCLHEDLRIRFLLQKSLKNALVGGIETVRYPGRLTINIFTARPGLIIGKKGSGVELLKKQIQLLTDYKLNLNIVELRNTSSDANLVAANIARQLEARFSYKRVVRQAVQNAFKAGARGVKISLAGRLAGAEIAKKSIVKEGLVPLHTLRVNLDYGFSEAFTSFGVIGVKVWFCKENI